MNIADALSSVLLAQREVPVGESLKSNADVIIKRMAAQKDLKKALETAIQSFGEDSPEPFGTWNVGVGGAQGIASPVAWNRIYDNSAPSATDNWYVVYLFAEDGERVYLTVARGSTNATKSTRSEVQRMRELISNDSSSRSPLSDADGNSLLGTSNKAREYANVTAWAKEYSASTLQQGQDAELVADLRSALSKLVTVRDEKPTLPPAPSTGEDWLIEKLRAYKNVILEGVAGTGKSFYLDRLRDEFGQENVGIVVLHPATAYEDFVEGLRPDGSSFSPMDGVFLDFCRRAANSLDDNKEFVLVLDEINRANTSKVLGDLLYSIEPSKRVTQDAARMVLEATTQDPDVDVTWVTLQLKRTDDHGATYRQRLCVPQNLYLLGTMNTTDRSVGTIDLALRRRFVFQRFEPLSGGDLKKMLASSALDEHVDTWAQLNTNLMNEVGPDAVLGHSYFFDFKSALDRSPHGLDLWKDLLLPQLAEVLVSFNALGNLELITSGLNFGGNSIQIAGKGLDAYPVITSID